MHSFQDLELKTLKKICSRYNLHVKIAKYSKLSKEELIPHMEKHLHITAEGKIKMREGKYDNVNNELSKLIDELKSKVKEVKEKVKKQQAKKIIPKQDKEVKNLMKAGDMAVKVMDNMKKADEKAEVKAVEQMKENLGVKPAKEKKGMKMKKEKKEIKKEMMKQDKHEDEEYTKEEKKAMMERLDKIPINDVIKEGLRGNMKTMSKKDFTKLIEEWEADQKPRQRRARAGQEVEKEDNMMEYKKAKEKKLNIVEKVASLEDELKKLEKMIKIDEKQNEKEHKQLRTDIYEEDEDNKMHKERQYEMKRLVEKPLQNIKYLTDDDYRLWKKDNKEEKERFISNIIKYKYQEFIKNYPVINNYYKKYLRENNIDEALEDNIYEETKKSYKNNYDLDLDDLRKKSIKENAGKIEREEIHEPQFKMKSRDDDVMDFSTAPKRTKRPSGGVEIDFSKRVIRD